MLVKFTFLSSQMDPDFKEQALVDVNEQLIHKWIYIRDTYSHTMLYKCLEVFSECASLVFWLREATNGWYLCIYV